MAKQYRVKCRALDDLGKGIVTFNQSRFSVPYLLDHETAKIELIYKKDRKDTKARLVEVEEASPERVTPPCPVFGRCGGCSLQHMNYQKQISVKQTAAEHILGGFAKVSPILAAKKPYHYRHKIHATFYRNHTNTTLGIYEENSHRVVPVKDCKIQNEKANAILVTIQKLAERFRLPAYNEDSGRGLLRHVLIRVGYHTGQIMVVLVTGNSLFPGRKDFVKALLSAHPQITTILQNVNSKRTSMVLGDKETILYGNGYIEDSLFDLTFRISPKSFYQVNPEQTELLYRTAIEFAGLTGRETVLDAYCGTGTIGLLASGQAASVIGVENNSAAVRDAIANASANRITNTRFICADATEYIKTLAVKCKQNPAETNPQVVFMDPPRTGSTKEFITSLLSLAPAKIIYVSCSMETLARDLTLFTAGGYEVSKIQPVDMFPWTEHVETVCLLSKKH